MIDEYIEKTHLAINEGKKNLLKGKLDKGTYYRVLEEYFSSIYQYVKDHINEIDANTFARITSLENNVDDFIVPFKTHIEAPNEVDNSDDYLLETIVYFTRKQLKVKESVEFSTDNLRKYDDTANTYVKDMCKRLGLLCYCFNIADVFDIPKNHNIAIVKVDERYYLVDTTYQQYFMLGQNFKDRYLKSEEHVVTCEVGARILGINKEGTIELLERGFIDTQDIMFEDYFTTMFEQYSKEPLVGEEYLDIILKHFNN